MCINWTHRYYLGTPESRPGQRHLYRITSIPPKYGEPLNVPECLTCTPDTTKMPTSTKAPIKLVTSWDDDWDDEPKTLPPPTSMPSRKHSKKHEPKKPPEICQYFNAEFPPMSSNHILIQCLGPIIPTTSIYRVSTQLNEKPLELIYHIENNTKLAEKVSKIALPQVKTFPVMISGGYHAQVRMYLPPGLREDEITRYPMVLYV